MAKGYDVSISRKRLWEITFGSEPLPSTVPNAAKLFAGSLGEDLDITDTAIQEAINKTDLD